MSRALLRTVAVASALVSTAHARQVDIGSPLRAGDVVVRRSKELRVYRPGSGNKPVAKAALTVVGSNADHFAGGLAANPDGDVFFSDKEEGNVVKMLPAGANRSTTVVAFPAKSRDWRYVTALLAPTSTSLFVMTTGGVLYKYARRGAAFEKVAERKVVGVQIHGGTLVGLPGGDHALLTVNWSAPKANVFVIRLEDMRVVSTLGDELGLFARPSGAVFVQAARPFIVLSSGHLTGDPTKNTRHLIMLGYDAKIHEITPPVKANRPDGFGCSLVSNTHDKNAWIAMFGGAAYDPIRKRVYLTSNTQRDGCNLYSVDAERLASGGLTVADLTPEFECGGRQVVVVPKGR